MTLLGFLDYTGRIIIDGVDVSKISLERLRSVITAISQDDFEFEGTVRYNLFPAVMGSDTSETPFDDEMVLSLLRELKLFELLDKEKGLDTEVSKMELSHGQKQLMSIARSCVRNFTYKTKIVVMDEATSNLDHEIEAIVLNAIREVFSDCTVIMVAHRTETLKDASIEMELDDGKLCSIKRNSRPVKMVEKRSTEVIVPGQSGLFPKADTPRPRPKAPQAKKQSAAQKLQKEIVESAELHIQKLREQARLKAVMAKEEAKASVQDPAAEKNPATKKARRAMRKNKRQVQRTEEVRDQASDLEMGTMGKGKGRAI